jgi:hypothetical protein
MLLSLARVRWECLNGRIASLDGKDRPMKRSRRVVLTMMGTAAVGAVSMGFVRPGDCGPYGRPGPDGRWPDNCRVRYGGFGGGGFRAIGHGHGHGGHGGGG